MDDLTLGHEPATGQVVIDGRAAGPAGEAGLVPADGVDLAFDRADGHLVRATLDAGSAAGADLLARLFGPRAVKFLREAEGAEETGRARPFPVSPEAGLSAALSSLARLDAARATSPVATSPWWAAEAAELAAAAGLQRRAPADARRAVRAWGQGGPLTERPRPPGAVALDVAAEVEGLTQDCARRPGPQWTLDPGLAPAWLFRPGLTPHSDLLVRQEAGGGRVLVEATPGAGAQRAVVDRWRARLVDPAAREVLGAAGFRESGSGLLAEILVKKRLTADISETWVEVVEDAGRPVRSARAHLIQRALRWADAALRAGRAPAGLAPGSSLGDWSALAGLAWERCVSDWAAAGRTFRTVPAARTLPPGPACLAEILGE